MNALTTTQATMSSLELVDFININRQHGDPELRHDNFMTKVPKVLGEGGLLNLQDTYIHPQNGQTYPCYNFPKREACLMAMSYSYDLQAKVFDRMTELESQKFQLPTTFSGALRLAAEQAEFIEKQNLALEKAAPKVAHYDLVVDKSTLLTATQVAQKVGMSAVFLNKILEELKVYHAGVKRSRVFQQWFIDKKYGELKQTENGYNQALFTIAGEAWVIQKLTSEGVI